ncbi:MAG: 50S ribosomal protein L6 [Candidatus Methylomirabilales bacterium]
MSRIGRAPVPIPDRVTVQVDGRQVHVEGPRGTLTLEIPQPITLRVVDGRIHCDRPTNQKAHRALHGLTRALVANMVRGVTAGFQRKLELVGVGYRAQVQGKTLVLALGYSQPVVYAIPADVKIEMESQTTITVGGIDKQRVGAVAAKIRSLRPPEPYKGKGVRYAGEWVRKKAGKTGARA